MHAQMVAPLRFLVPGTYLHTMQFLGCRLCRRPLREAWASAGGRRQSNQVSDLALRRIVVLTGDPIFSKRSGLHKLSHLPGLELLRSPCET